MPTAASTARSNSRCAGPLNGAIAALTLDQGGYRVLEAEQSDEWSGGDLKNEANSSAGNLGGVRDGSWIRYKNLDFAGVAPKTLTIRYSNSSSPSGTPSSIEVHAGTQDGPIVGKAALPGTGSWGNWVTVQAEITDPEALTQARDVTLVFHAPAGQAWVSNFDWFQFLSTAPGEGPGNPGATLKPPTVRGRGGTASTSAGTASRTSPCRTTSRARLGHRCNVQRFAGERSVSPVSCGPEVRGLLDTARSGGEDELALAVDHYRPACGYPSPVNHRADRWSSVAGGVRCGRGERLTWATIRLSRTQWLSSVHRASATTAATTRTHRDA